MESQCHRYFGENFYPTLRASAKDSDRYSIDTCMLLGPLVADLHGREREIYLRGRDALALFTAACEADPVFRAVRRHFETLHRHTQTDECHPGTWKFASALLNIGLCGLEIRRVATMFKKVTSEDMHSKTPALLLANYLFLEKNNAQEAADREVVHRVSSENWGFVDRIFNAKSTVKAIDLIQSYAEWISATHIRPADQLIGPPTFARSVYQAIKMTMSRLLVELTSYLEWAGMDAFLNLVKDGEKPVNMLASAPSFHRDLLDFVGVIWKWIQANDPMLGCDHRKDLVEPLYMIYLDAYTVIRTSHKLGSDEITRSEYSKKMPGVLGTKLEHTERFVRDALANAGSPFAISTGAFVYELVRWIVTTPMDHKAHNHHHHHVAPETVPSCVICLDSLPSDRPHKILCPREKNPCAESVCCLACAAELASKSKGKHKNKCPICKQ